MRWARAILLALCSAGVAIPAPALDFAAARAIVTFSDAQISPDGNRIAFVAVRGNYRSDRNETQLMLLDVRSRSVRPLTFERRGVSSPRWSPDGRTIAFTAESGEGENAQTQIFLLRMDGGEARRITNASEGVDAFVWSPSGSRIAYLAADPDPHKKEIEANHDAFEVGSNDYLRTSASTPSHPWIVDLAQGRTHRLTAGSWSATVDQGGGTISWSADGRDLAITRFPTPYFGDSLPATVQLVDVANGSLRALSGVRGFESTPTFAPRGELIAFERNASGDSVDGVNLFVANRSGADQIDVRAGIDRSVDDFAWGPRGDGLYLSAADAGVQRLWYHHLGGPPQHVALGDVAPESLGNTAHDGSLVFVGSTAQHPPEVYLLRAPTDTPLQLTHLNDAIARDAIGRSTVVSWIGSGGFHEDGVLTYPPGWRGGKAPLVLVIHGGPQGSSTLGWSTQRQVFASHGYLIFEPNYRGSTNLGDRFERAIAGNTGDGPGKDVMAGVAAVQQLGIVDSSRIAVSGWSYGGYMTAWLIGHYHLWKAAVAGASLDDWFDDYNDSFYVAADAPFFGGPPANPKYRAQWRTQSPIAYATAITTPTLILADVGDNNVTITNSYKLYHALKDNGIPVTFVAYPVSGHHPSDPVRNEDQRKRWLGWIDKYLRPGETAP